MDKNTITGLLLIGAIMLTFFIFNAEEPKNDAATDGEVATQEDSVANVQPELSEVEADTIVEEVIPFREDSVKMASVPDSIRADEDALSLYIAMREAEEKLQNELKADKAKKAEYGNFYPSQWEGEEEVTFLENDKIKVALSNKGGRISGVWLKEYQSYDDFADNPEQIVPLELLESDRSKHALRLIHEYEAGNDVQFETSELKFDLVSNKSEEATKELIYRLKTTDDSKYIDFIYSLNEDSYEVGYQIAYNGFSSSEIRLGRVNLIWNVDAPCTEKLASDQRRQSAVMYRYFGEGRDYISELSSNSVEFEGKVNWMAFKNKFFSSVIISEDGLKGSATQTQFEDPVEDYTVKYESELELPSSNIVDLKFFFGPNKSDLLSAYDNEMDDIIDNGWGIFGWVNKWMIQPIFNMLNGTGFGLGIIIFLVTLFVKIIVTPLTYKNYKSSAKMRVLRPEIDKINEKYKDNPDPVKKQQETMALYKSTGVNPMAGCVPMLIQMPILLAVFRFFPSSIDLRHRGFLWAEDLSSYDSVWNFGFDIPMYGDHVSLFALLMAASTLIYTMMNSSQMAPSQPGMPNMKVIMYFFPIMMLFFFNEYSAGLSYYYLCGNLMNIGIIWGIKKYMIDEDKLRAQIESNKKKPKKKSKLQQRMEDFQKQQQKKR